LLIENALQLAHGDIANAAATLGIPRKTLYDKLAKLAVDVGRFRPAAFVPRRSPPRRLRAVDETAAARSSCLQRPSIRLARDLAPGA